MFDTKDKTLLTLSTVIGIGVGFGSRSLGLGIAALCFSLLLCILSEK